MKPKAIKTIGLIITIFSGFLVLGNLAGILMQFSGSPIKYWAGTGDMPFLLKHIVETGIVMVLLGLVFLYGGLQLMKYKLLGKKIVVVVSILFLFVIFFIMIGLMLIFSNNGGAGKEMVIVTVLAIIWSLPFIFLPRYLKSSKIFTHLVSRKNPEL